MNFGGSLTRSEQATAAAQMELLTAKTTAAKTAERDLAAEANAAARAVGAMGSEGAYALDRFTALGGVLGSSGAFGLGVGAAVIGLTGLFEMGKSMINNADAQETAANDLAQAYATLGEKAPIKVIDQFINQNARFIPSMYAVEEGFASLARAGFNDTEQMKLMNLALDLSAAKHIDLTTATTALIDAEHGRMLGLISLGISAKEINDIEGKNATQAQKNAELEALLTQKLHGARESTSQLKQSQDQLSVTWERMSNDNGPALSSMLATVIGKTDDFLNLLRNSDWGGFDNVLTTIAGGLHQVGIEIDNVTNKVNNFAHTTANYSNGRVARVGPPPRSSGGGSSNSAGVNTSSGLRRLTQT